MIKRELIDELLIRKIGRDLSEVKFRPEPIDNKDLVKRLKNLHADLTRVLQAPVGSIAEDIDTVLYNLQTEIDELDEPPTPELILIDTLSEVWINNEPVIVFEK